jgi:tetratricopeptide (TPR) repeat protein
MLRYAMAVLAVLVSSPTWSKTPGQIYEHAAKSTVVVRNIDSSGKVKSIGSGVVLQDMSVVTNCHVVKGASQLNVRIRDKEHAAKVRYSDWDRDVCSLSVPGLSASAVILGSTKTLKIGAKVYAIGAPKGLELSLSDGIVSSLREVAGGHYIQTTAPISPGSSGGGLFDENGMLVGLITFYLTEGQNLNFAVPVEWVKELAKRSYKKAALAQTTMDWLNKAIELETLKNWAAVIEHSRSWTNTQPENDMAWFTLGAAYAEVGKFSEAIESTQKALRINPERASAWINLGMVYDSLSQASMAVDAYQQALRINPEHAEAWYNLGNSYGKTGQFGKAIDAFQQSLRINPEFGHAWINLGVIYRKTRQFQKAIEAGQKALQVNPEDAKAWHNLGLTYGVADQFPIAIEALQQAVRINPGDIDAWYDLGLAYTVLGLRGKAIEVYKQLKTLDPTLAERFFNEEVVPR